MSLLDDISPSNSRAFVSAGMRIFASGDVAGSIDAFDRSEAAVPDGSLTPYLWQRGISYYYADSFREGSEQFRTDVKVNPLDVEEIVWDIACLARLNPNDPFPPENRLALPIGKTDRRKIMSTISLLWATVEARATSSTPYSTWDSIVRRRGRWVRRRHT